MLARKLKQKLLPKSAPPPATPMQPWKERLVDAADQAMQRWFHLPQGWYMQRDIVKNNYALGIKNFRAGRYQDAALRLKITTWLDPKHADAWYTLGRALLAFGKRAQGLKALEKAAALSHEDAVTLTAVFTAEKSTISIHAAKAAAALSALHQDSFPAFWKEKDIAEMLAIAGTEASIAGTPQLAMGMIMGRALGDQYEILTMAVSPEWRRRGIGRLLLGHAKTEAKKSGAKTMFLEVAEDNIAAARLYGQEGFTEISRRKDYYKNADGLPTPKRSRSGFAQAGGFTDAIVMRLEFAA